MILISVFIVTIFIRDGGIATALPIIGVLGLGAQDCYQLCNKFMVTGQLLLGVKHL